MMPLTSGFTGPPPEDLPSASHCTEPIHPKDIRRNSPNVSLSFQLKELPAGIRQRDSVYSSLLSNTDLVKELRYARIILR